MFQSADVGRTLISADRLSEAGCEVILNKKKPRIVTKTGKVIQLKRKGGIFIFTMWVKVPSEDTGPPEKGEVLAPVFVRQDAK